MKHSLVVFAFAIFAQGASAGVLTCSFTEPFINVEYNSETGVVTEVGVEHYNEKTNGFEPVVIAKKAKLIITDDTYNAQTAELRGENGLILTIKFTGQGSNGMSDHIYPFEGVMKGLYGGCDTAKYPAYTASDVFGDLGVEQ